MKNLLLLSLIALWAFTPAEAQITKVINAPGAEHVQIQYDVKTGSDVVVEIYNALGQLVSTPLSTFRAEGKHTLTLSNSTLREAGKVYFLRVSIGDNTYTRKMVNL